jgi:nucleoid-associated protein
LNGGALFNAEFGIRHRGSTVPERSGVALSFCRRPFYDFIRNKDYGLSAEIPADKRTLNQFRRFTGRAEGMSISFEQHLLGSKIEFDQEAGTLILRGLPTQLADQLKRASA